jgi:hypothetical protein
MARTRRAATSSAPAPPPAAADDRSFRIQAASVASILALVLAVYFLLQIHSPPLARLVAGAGSVGTGLLAALSVLDRARGLKAFSPFFDELTKKASGALGRPRLAAALAIAALVLVSLTAFHWRASARCPVLRIVPGRELAYYLMDGAEADKPPERTIEIRVRWKSEVRRFHPRDARTLDVGASESVLRWRAAREDQEDSPKRSYLGTDRFRAGDEVTVEVFCRKPDTMVLDRVKWPIGPAPLQTVALSVDEEQFSRKVGACEPI